MLSPQVFGGWHEAPVVPRESRLMGDSQNTGESGSPSRSVEILGPFFFKPLRPCVCCVTLRRKRNFPEHQKIASCQPLLAVTSDRGGEVEKTSPGKSSSHCHPELCSLCRRAWGSQAGVLGCGTGREAFTGSSHVGVGWKVGSF